MGIRNYPQQKTQSIVYFGSNVNSSTVGRSGILGGIQNPALSAAELVNNGITTDGNYYFRPSGSSTTIQSYVNFSNAPSGKGYVLVARGRESTDWWNINGQNYTTGLLQASLSTNTPISVAPNDFVNGLIGGNWNSMKMLVNRLNNADSLYIQGASSSTFSWATFDGVPASLTASLARYTSSWKGGSLSYNVSNQSQWTDTYNYGASNDCTRSFTWTWTDHGGYKGWSGGSSCTPAGSFQNGSEGHAIQLVNVYIEC